MRLLPFRRKAKFSALVDNPLTTVDGVITALNAKAAYNSMLSVSREEALSVPAVLRGRNLICSIATLPLVMYSGDRVATDSALLKQVDPQVPNVVLWSQIVEDLLFNAIGWLRVTRRNYEGYPTSAVRVAPHRVSERPPNAQALSLLPSGFDIASTLWIDGQPVSAYDMIRFDSPNPAVLYSARRAIRRAISLEDASAMYADNPRPADYFTVKDGEDDPQQDAVTKFLNDWGSARQLHATAYVPGHMDYRSVDIPTPRDLQLVELQKRATLDIANALGLSPEELGESTTSRTYQNITDRRRDKINDVLSVYMLAITDRLSMNDVTKRGYTVRFDLAEYLKADPITRTSYYAAMVSMGALDVREIREQEYLPALEVINGTAPNSPQL